MTDEHTRGSEEIIAASVKTDALAELRPLLKPGTEPQAKAALVRVVSKFHSGPIPPAEELRELESVQPGLADRIVSMAEKEQQHRHSLEDTLVSREFNVKFRGQHYAFAAVVVILAVAGYMAFLGHAKEGAYLAGTTLVACVGAFLTSEYINRSPKKPAPVEQPEPRPNANSTPKKKRRT